MKNTIDKRKFIIVSDGDPFFDTLSSSKKEAVNKWNSFGYNHKVSDFPLSECDIYIQEIRLTIILVKE